jgi:predicted CoA-binding protein
MLNAASTFINTFLFFVVVVVVVVVISILPSSVVVTAFSMNMNNPETIRKVLTNTKTIALIGASIKPKRPSNYVMKFLLDNGYNVIPINPGLKEGSEIHGQKVYDSLSSIPTRNNIDMVDIFRNSDAVPSIVDEILEMNMNNTYDDKRHHNIKSIWMQVGVINEDACKKAKNAGLDVIMDACPKIEMPKLNIIRPTTTTTTTTTTPTIE